ncbi:MAG TPA: carboxypeptidase-like regulatory domain-containing protein, partial [Polyangiaceae bacterium]|nr:carboxypeptidase-like regulatory domain-containing protein [Polyangiaceae bacterium]
SQDDAPGTHHRLGGRAAVGVTPLDWLDVSLATNFRNDRHTVSDDLGSDQGSAIDSELYAQVGHALGSDFHVGTGLRASFVRGVTLGRSLESPALDLQLLAAYVPKDSSSSVGLLAGFRYDRTAQAVLAPNQYRAGDRLALGLSAFNAVPLGLGASHRFGATELVGELSGELLLGSDAPDIAASPWRASAGVRQRLSDVLALRLMTETALGSRPAVGADDPLTPIEPRFQVLAGLTYALLDWQPSASAPAAAPPGALTRPPAAAPSTLCALRVNVWTIDGFPLSDAKVELESGGKRFDVPHQNLEGYELGELARGDAIVHVSAPRLKPKALPVRLRPGEPLTLDVRLERAPQNGQVQGLVRSFGGKGLRAHIRIEPIGSELSTDASGRFVADVPPGRYQVVIDAPGHERQRRQIEVTPDGVVVVNADMVRLR